MAFFLNRLWFEYQSKPVLIVYVFGTMTYIGDFVLIFFTMLSYDIKLCVLPRRAPLTVLLLICLFH